MTSKRRRPARWSLYAPFAALAVALALYTAYWLYAAGEIRASIEGWIEDHRRAGYQIEHEGLSIGGYPFRFDARLAEPRMSAPPSEGGWRLSAPELAAGALPYDVNRWIVAARSPARLELDKDAGRGVYALRSDSARMSIAVRDGRTRRVGAEIDALEIETLEGPQAGVRRLEQLRLSGGLSDADELIIRAEANALTLAPGVVSDDVEQAFGLEAERLRLDASVTQWGALAADGDAGRWAQAGGRFIVRRAQLFWGPAQLEGDGDVTLDSRARVDGRLSVIMADPDALFDALIAGRVISRDQGEALRLAAMMAPRREAGVALPFRLQDGGLFLGPARVGDAPILR